MEDSRLTAVQASSDEAKLKPFQQFTLNADNLQCFLAGEKKDIIKPQVATSIFCSVVKIGSLKLFGHKNGMARKEQGFPEEKKNTKPYFVWRGCGGGKGSHTKHGDGHATITVACLHLQTPSSNWCLF